VVDDFEPFRRFVRSILQERPELQVICEVSDGLEAVQKAEELQPDVILLDIGLPRLNGIEAARRIREIAPQSKILFVSAIGASDVAAEALRVGGSGYVVKALAGHELLSAVEAVLRGEVFVSSSLRSHDPVAPHRPNKVQPSRRHAVTFYRDDASFVRSVGRFIEAALSTGSAVIVVATEAHRISLASTLQAQGLDIAAAIEQGRYMALDAASAVSTFMVNDLPDPARFLGVADNLITTAANCVLGEHPRVALCGECDPPLWTLGNGEAAIQVEQLWNQIAMRYDVDILCAYPMSSFHEEQNRHMFKRICAEHSVVHALGY
jgi:CheY-like chemotaxis protein